MQSMATPANQQTIPFIEPKTRQPSIPNKSLPLQYSQEGFTVHGSRSREAHFERLFP
jgi:hypothetical protein